MKPDTANIIAFPTTHRGTEAKPRPRQSVLQPEAQSAKLPSVHTRALARSVPKPLVARPMPRQLTAEEHAGYVASVVRIAIRSAKRRGVTLESLLPIPRKWLLDLCDVGDPTCILVRDWLTGTQTHLSSGLDDLATTPAPDEQGDA
ncbi:hypothetical protein [Hoeflea alexandrii]|uniref:hypothetical protein n=1 Tax=Hoeflea alexandrii TaxID=288436 RepID=UPI0022705FA5|nr:hypothetical protein [Hoeflea alexandrii]MCY0154988.1 hypothetical protein [Hoeflea alexandrii]